MAGDETAEREEIQYTNPEAMKTILVEGFRLAYSERDPSIISLSLLSTVNGVTPVIFCELALTLQRAEGLIESLEKTVEKCNEVQKSLTESKTLTVE